LGGVCADTADTVGHWPATDQDEQRFYGLRTGSGAGRQRGKSIVFLIDEPEFHLAVDGKRRDERLFLAETQT
jgi:hypothetical protein